MDCTWTSKFFRLYILAANWSKTGQVLHAVHISENLGCSLASHIHNRKYLGRSFTIPHENCPQEVIDSNGSSAELTSYHNPFPSHLVLHAASPNQPSHHTSIVLEHNCISSKLDFSFYPTLFPNFISCSLMFFF